VKEKVLLEYVMRLAAEEAVLSSYSEVTPAHLLIALARVADPDTTDSLPVSDSSLREAFEHFGIEPERFRHRLRTLIGTGDGQRHDDVIPESAACKSIRIRARRIAAARGLDGVVWYLLEATMLSLADTR